MKGTEKSWSSSVLCLKKGEKAFKQDNRTIDNKTIDKMYTCNDSFFFWEKNYQKDRTRFQYI